MAKRKVRRKSNKRSHSSVAARKPNSIVSAIVWMILYWALYLSLTMLFFESYNITPEVVPGGFFGWMFIVEVPRVLIGWIVSIPLFGKN